MTTAHRPTWKAAVGKSSEGGWTAGGARSAGVSHLDLAAHTKLKVRRGTQVVDKNKALRESLFKLEQAEKSRVNIGTRKLDEDVERQGRQRLLKQTAEIDDKALRDKYDDDDAKGGSGSDSSEREDNLDDSESDLDGNGDSDDDDDDSDDDDDDDSDDEAALQAELAKIRAEREAAKQQQASEEAAAEEAEMEEAALIGNPLLSSNKGAAATGRLKRKWNDDVVFRNQAKNEPKVPKRFINDTVRNDFHKRFLNKFVR